MRREDVIIMFGLIGLNFILGLLFDLITRRKKLKHLEFIFYAENEFEVKKGKLHKLSVLISKTIYVFIGFYAFVVMVNNEEGDLEKAHLYVAILFILFLSIFYWLYNIYVNTIDIRFTLDRDKDTIVINGRKYSISLMDSLEITYVTSGVGANLPIYIVKLKFKNRKIEICTGAREEIEEMVDGLFRGLAIEIIDHTPYNPTFRNLSRNLNR